jgi:peptidoglycan/xylan/chitin deacetylase (PgdA/CDA1 family)
MIETLRSEYIIDAASLAGMRQAALRLWPDDAEARNNYMAKSWERITRKKLVGFEPEAINLMVKAVVQMMNDEALDMLSMFDVLRCAGVLGYSSDRLARSLSRWLEKSAGIKGGYALAEALAGILPHFNGRGEDPSTRKDKSMLRPAKSKRQYTLSEESALLYPSMHQGVDLVTEEERALPDFSIDSILDEFYQRQTDKISEVIGFDIHDQPFPNNNLANLDDHSVDAGSIEDEEVLEFYKDDGVAVSYPEELAFADEEFMPLVNRVRRRVRESLPPRILRILQKKQGFTAAESALLELAAEDAQRTLAHEALIEEPAVEIEEHATGGIELAPLPQPRSYPLIEDGPTLAAVSLPAMPPPSPGPWGESTNIHKNWYEPENRHRWRWPLHLTYKTVAIAAIAGLFALSALLAPTFINVNAGSIGQWGIFSTPTQKPGEEPEEKKDAVVAAPGIPVLLYHHLRQKMHEDESLAGVIISVDNFTQQMDYLKNNGYTTITLLDLYNYVSKGSELPDQAVLITFDDGYKDNFYYAYPILKERGFNAAIFTITDRTTVEPVPLNLETDFVQKMSMEEMRLSADVFEFGSHTHNMHRLGNDNRSLLVTASREEVLKDMMVSKKILDTDFFAYPYGQYTPETIRNLQETGYIMAFINQPGYVKTGDDIYTLPRIEIRGDISIERFAEILAGAH